MKTQFYYKELDEAEKQKVTSYVDTKLDQLEKFLQRVPTGERRLQVKVEKFAKKAAYQVEFILLMPKETFHAKEDDHTLNEAVDFALEKLTKQLRRRH